MADSAGRQGALHRAAAECGWWDELRRYGAVMPADRLPPTQLHAWVESSLRLSGLDVFKLRELHHYAVTGSALEPPVTVSIYAKNITHGGGSERAPDEFRIQLTPPMPHSNPGETLVIIGWSTLHQVFVGWDPRLHDGRTSSSPSLQVREDVMRRAARNGSAAALRQSGDVVAAFAPGMLAAYCLNVREVHSDASLETVQWLDALGQLAAQDDPSRPTVIRRMEVAYRAWDFSRRVRDAYGRVCVICGIGLGLVEGAHIVPVAWPGSTDETSNGLAMCRNHHAAYDRGVISVTPDLRVELSREHYTATPDTLSAEDHDWLKSIDGRSLLAVPHCQVDRPDPRYLEIGRIARGWRS